MFIKKSIHRILLTITLLMLTFGSASISTAQDDSSTPTPGEPLVARVFFTGQADLNRLATRLDVWEVDHTAGYLVALLSPDQYAGLQQAGYRVEIDTEQTARLDRLNQPLPGQVSGIPGFPCYRTVEETYASLAQLAVDHPDLAQWIDIGDSWEKVTPAGQPGYDLHTLVLTNISIPGPKPKFYLMSAIHAREYTTAELATRYAEFLVANYGVDPDITWLLDYYEVHITPHANPDGRKIAETGVLWRKNVNPFGCLFPNSRGVDLNRNSSFKWGGGGASPYGCDDTYRGPSAASEPETQAIQAYVASIYPDQRGPGDNDPAPADSQGIFITLHSYSELVLFPWGWKAGPSPNVTQLETLGRKFGYFNHYKVCQPDPNDCLYHASGTTDDWAYGELGVTAYTFELGNYFFEGCSSFDNEILPANLPALLYALKAARRPYQDPAGPESLQVQVSPAQVNPGTPVSLTAKADDTRYDSGGPGSEPVQNIAEARYSIDQPSWMGGTTYPLSAADGNFDNPMENLQATVDTAGLSQGRHLIFVESQDADGHWGVPSAVFLDIGEVSYAPDLAPDQSTGQAAPGQTATYTLTLTNLGTSSDSFDLQFNGNTWDTNAQPNPAGPLGSGESQEIAVQVTIPPDATPGSSDIATITAISQGDTSKTASATITTTAVEPYGVTLTPEHAEELGFPGHQVFYILQLTNRGVLEDRFTAQIGSHAWETTLQAPDGPLGPGQSVDVMVTVTLPADAAFGASDTVQVTFTSQGKPDKSASASLKTTAGEPVAFLPITFR